MKKKVKFIIWIVIAISSGFLIWQKYSQPVEVDGLKTVSSTVEINIKEQGTVNSTMEYPVSSFTKGRVEELLIEEGQQVKKDQPLIKISSKELEFQQEQLNAQFESVVGQEQEANKKPLNSQLQQHQINIDDQSRRLNNAIEDYKKIEEDYLQLKISKTELDDSKKKVDDAKASLEREEAALRLIKDNAIQTEGSKRNYQGQKDSIATQIENIRYQLSKNEFIAPFDGIVKGLEIKVGSVIMPDTKLFTLIEKDKYVVDTFVLPEDAVFLKLNDKVKLIQKRKDGDEEFNGTIIKIANSAIEKVSALGIVENRVKVTIEPAKDEIEKGNPKENKQVISIFPGYTVDVNFTLQSRKNAIAIPKNSIFSSNGKDYVWKVINNTTALTEVKKGFKTDDSVLIENGIVIGDIVVYNPQETEIKEGTRVKVNIK